ncbi:MAG TPA: outer membrane beta-barrel protein, partial [Myxococcota bacterium]|nr:outer membrane beta-barrel protein [Myxococcota bacterium]
MIPKPLIAAAFAFCAGAAHADYVGTLKPPQSPFAPSGLYSLASDAGAVRNALAGDPGFRLRLGYKYSPYFAVEGEFLDFGRGAADVFATPGDLAGAPHGNGFGVSTFAVLPIWRFSLYGRLGAYRGDSRGGFDWLTPSLLPDRFSDGPRWRYGLGMRYDVTKSLGIRAEVARHSPLH